MNQIRASLAKRCAGMALAIIVAGLVWYLTREKSDQGAIETVDHGTITQKVKAKGAGQTTVTNVDTADKNLLFTALQRGIALSLKQVQKESDPVMRNQALSNLVDSIAQADVLAALEFVRGQGTSELASDFTLRLIRRWAENDPAAASGWVDRLPEGAERREAINAVAVVWANHNLADALAWIGHFPEGAERSEGVTKVAYELARTDPIKAMTLAVDLPRSNVRDELITHAANQWAAIAPEAAAEWAGKLGDTGLRERVLGTIATAWGETNPEAAAEIAVKSLSPGKIQDDAVMGIMQRWAQIQPADTGAWVAQFPEGKLRETAAEELVKLWADQNTEEAGKWLDSLAPGPSRDKAVGAYVGKIVFEFPDLAAQWAMGIGDEAMKFRELARVAESWLSTDLAAARTWINQSALPQSTKDRLLAAKVQ